MRWVVGGVSRRGVLLSVGVACLALVSTVLVALQKLDPHFGSPLAGALAVVAASIPALERLIKELQPTVTTDGPQPLEVTAEDVIGIVQELRPYWMAEVQRSLEGLSRIDIRLSERAEAVDNPMRLAVRRPGEHDRQWESGTAMVTVYRALGEQLLILGEPGAGKSTLLRILAQQLMSEADEASVRTVPLVFDLASWAVHRPPFAIWLVDQLHRRYGVERRAGAALVDGEHVIPLLDGLDEVAAERQNACVSAINSFHADHGLLPLVVCSRTSEYERLGERLALRGAVLVQPLNQIEVERYLRRGGRSLAGVRDAVDQDARMWDLLTVPLFLTIVTQTYRDRGVGAMRSRGSFDAQRELALADYVDAMLEPRSSHAPPPPYSADRTVSWLSWLARAMHGQGQSVFHPDWMQPDWLPSERQRRSVTVGLAARLGLWVGLLFAPLMVVAQGLGNLVLELAQGVGTPASVLEDLGLNAARGLLGAAALGVVVGLAAYAPDIAPTEKLRWSWSAVGRSLRRWWAAALATGLVGGLMAGLVTGLVFVEALYPHSSPRGRVLLGVAVGVGAVLGLALGIEAVVGLASGVQTRPYATPEAPGRGMRRSGRNAMVSGLLAWSATLVGGTVMFVVFGELVLRLPDLSSGPGPSRTVLAVLVLLSPFFVAGVGASMAVALIIGLAVSFVLLGRKWLDRMVMALAAAMLLAAAGLLGFGLLVGLVLGLRHGGAAYLRHRALRRQLVRNGSLPRDHIAFYEHAVSLGLLRRRAGGYEFLHRLLLDHLARRTAAPLHALEG